MESICGADCNNCVYGKNYNCKGCSNTIYLGNQVESEFNNGEIIRCFGILANMSFILVSEYGANGDNPELIIYKKR